MPRPFRMNSTPFAQVNARLPLDLVQAAKQTAMAQRITLTRFLEHALRGHIAAYQDACASLVRRLTSQGGWTRDGDEWRQRCPGSEEEEGWHILRRGPDGAIRLRCTLICTHREILEANGIDPRTLDMLPKKRRPASLSQGP